jgi:hypothetical protein
VIVLSIVPSVSQCWGNPHAIGISTVMISVAWMDFADESNPTSVTFPFKEQGASQGIAEGRVKLASTL